MIEVTVQQVIDTTRAIVAERPDYIYTNEAGEVTGPLNSTPCSNVHRDDEGKLIPGCLVGTVLAKLGAPLEELATEGMNSTAAYESVPSFITTGSNRADEGIIEFLAMAQVRQDLGDTWSVALAKASKHIAIPDTA